jgi:hypothetical protein
MSCRTMVVLRINLLIMLVLSLPIYHEEDPGDKEKANYLCVYVIGSFPCGMFTFFTPFYERGKVADKVHRSPSQTRRKV